MPSPALEQLVTQASAPPHAALQASIVRALEGLDPRPILEAVTPQAPRRYQGWSLASGPTAQLSVFALGPHTEIRLHDHPGMHVFTRVLHGDARVEAWDWADRERLEVTNHTAAQFRPGSDVWLTEPQRQNLHALDAGRMGCVFVDLFLPYYDEDAGRRCSYYEVTTRRGARARLRRLARTRQAD